MPGGHIVAVGWALLAGSELPRIPLLETVWKLLYTDYTSHHQSCHRRVDKGLPGGAQPLEVFGHPPVVRDPREGALHHPPSRQHPKTLRRHELLPIHLLAFLGPLPCPSLGHLLRERLPRLAHHLHTQSHNLLGPTSPPSLASSVDPQVSKAREEIAARRIQQHPNAICVRDSGAVYGRALSTKPSVSTRRWRFLPSTCLAGSKPRSLPPTPVVLTVWESTIAALGSGSLPSRARRRSRSSVFRRSQVPSMRHLLNQS